MDFLKSTKGGTLWVGRGSNPWGGGGVAPPPLNPPLVETKHRLFSPKNYLLLPRHNHKTTPCISRWSKSHGISRVLDPKVKIGSTKTELENKQYKRASVTPQLIESLRITQDAGLILSPFEMDNEMRSNTVFSNLAITRTYNNLSWDNAKLSSFSEKKISSNA